MMRTIYTKNFHRALCKVMAERHPEFEPFVVRLNKDQRRDSTISPGEKIYVWRVRDDLWVFISFVPNRSQERFTIDIGWSRKKGFPWGATRIGSSFALERPSGVDECMIEFVDFLAKVTGNGVFFGWDVWSCSVPPEDPNFKRIFVEEYMKDVNDDLAYTRAEMAVRKALDDTDKYAFPWIRENLIPD